MLYYIIILYNYIITLWGDRRICVPSLTETSLCGACLYLVGTGVYFTRVKRPECDADHWPPYNGKSKNEWTCTSAPPYTFKACRGTAVPLPSQNTDIQCIQIRQKCRNSSQSLRSRTAVARQIKWTFYPPTCHSRSSRHTITL